MKKQIEVTFEVQDGHTESHRYPYDSSWQTCGQWVLVQGKAIEGEARPIVASYAASRVICIRAVETDEPTPENEEMLKEQFTDRGV